MKKQSPDMEYFWNLFKFSPNDEQKEAILHTVGPLYLPAGPGSGKTRVLLWRTFYLIVFKGVAPDKIFLSTFTRKAALQLKEGLLMLLCHASEELSRPFEISSMYIGTIHSLCQKIVQDRRFSSARTRTRLPVILDELSQFFYLYQGKGYKDVLFPEIGEHGPGVLWERINNFFDKRSGSKYTAISNLISFFNRISEEAANITTWQDNLTAGGGNGYHADFLWLLDLYQSYRNSLGSASPVRTDLSLLQQEALHYLERCDRAGEVFDHVIIDEYQDTNMVQEKIVFTLARGSRNICVVGDDDQALYRFRGATVENFVRFPGRVKNYLDTDTATIPLVKNYRSHRGIVSTYCRFMDLTSWAAADNGPDYRVGKRIEAVQVDTGSMVYRTALDSLEVCADQTAEMVVQLLSRKVVENANQIAFLFSSLRSKAVTLFKQALEKKGLLTYAPRANSFLFTTEATIVFGFISLILGEYKPRFQARELEVFKEWHLESRKKAEEIVSGDPLAAAFIEQKQEEMQIIKEDFKRLSAFLKKKKIGMGNLVDTELLHEMAGVTGLSRECVKTLKSKVLRATVEKRAASKSPCSAGYVVKSATALDWTLLDLFYRLCGLSYFKGIIELGPADEGPLYNLSYVAHYINKFTEEFKSMITAFDLQYKRIINSFFGSFLYMLYRREEKEFENEEDPFPLNRIPFLTIHQSKGLEFPVVVIGTMYRRLRIPVIDSHMSKLIRDREPLESQPEFDAMRRLYVAMSRAAHLLIINNAKRYVSADLKGFMASLPELSTLDVENVRKASLSRDQLTRSYSFTGDFNYYSICPFQYEIFKKFAFPPSRSQTMAFGALVHQTIEDLHEYILAKKGGYSR